VTADGRLTAARAFLASSRGRKLAERPHSVLIREAAELRRQLAQVLDVIDEGAEDDGTEPYCTTCLSWVGMFFGLAGWHHFRGDPAPGGKRVLYEAGHAAEVAWIIPPGRGLSPADMAGVAGALDHAGQLMRERSAAGCEACVTAPAGACGACLDQAGQADRYAALAGRIGGAQLDSESWTCTSCGGLFIGGRTPGGVCGECQAAGPVLPAEIAGQDGGRVTGVLRDLADGPDVTLARKALGELDAAEAGAGLRIILAAIGEAAAGTARESRQLAEVRAVLAQLGWDGDDDSQLALEVIDRIVTPRGDL